MAKKRTPLFDDDRIGSVGQSASALNMAAGTAGGVGFDDDLEEAREPMKQLNFRVPESIWREFHDYCRVHDRKKKLQF